MRPEITDVAGLKGRKIATPQLGNTQDVALRAWLKDQGLTSDVDGGGDVSIAPQANAEGLAAYASGGSTGRGCPSRGSRSTSRPARRCSLTRRPSGRRGSS